MNSYAYRVYRNGNLSNPIYGGTVHADDMESAGRKIIKSNKIEVIHEMVNLYPVHYFLLNGEKVGILVYLNPDEF